MTALSVLKLFRAIRQFIIENLENKDALCNHNLKSLLFNSPKTMAHTRYSINYIFWFQRQLLLFWRRRNTRPLEIDIELSATFLTNLNIHQIRQYVVFVVCMCVFHNPHYVPTLTSKSVSVATINRNIADRQPNQRPWKYNTLIIWSILFKYCPDHNSVTTVQCAKFQNDWASTK